MAEELPSLTVKFFDMVLNVFLEFLDLKTTL